MSLPLDLNQEDLDAALHSAAPRSFFTGRSAVRGSVASTHSAAKKVTWHPSASNLSEEDTEPSHRTGLFSSDSASGSSNSMGTPRGYVTIDEDAVASLRPEQFDYEPEGEESHPVVAFRFERSARKSLMLKMGLGKHVRRALTRSMSSNDGGLSSIDIYSKVDEKESITIYLACMIGMGSFQLSRAMAKCGLIPGLFALSVFSLIHAFLCHRLVEVPALVEESFELYVGVARVCLPRLFYIPCAFSCMGTWYMACVMYEKQTLQNLVQVTHPNNYETEKLLDGADFWWMKPLLILILIPVSWRTDVGLVSRCSKWALRSMLAAVALELLAAMGYALSHGRGAARRPPQLWGEQKLDGLQSMAMSFIGIGILPYIVAEMSCPHRTTHVINKSCLFLSAFYIFIALSGYLCWGPDILQCSTTPLQAMMELAHVETEDRIKGFKAFWYLFCGWAVGAMFTIKTMASFPLFLWPLVREVEGFMAFEDSPATEIQLPWATKGQISKRKWLKAMVVIFMIFPLLLDSDGYKIWIGFMVFGPTCFTHFALPAWAAFVGIWRHWEAVQLRTARQLTMQQIVHGGLGWWAQTPSNTTRRYFGKTFRMHFWTTCFVACTVIGFVLVLEWQWACQYIFKEEFQQEHCPYFTSKAHRTIAQCLRNISLPKVQQEHDRWLPMP